MDVVTGMGSPTFQNDLENHTVPSSTDKIPELHFPLTVKRLILTRARLRISISALTMSKKTGQSSNPSFHFDDSSKTDQRSKVVQEYLDDYCRALNEADPKLVEKAREPLHFTQPKPKTP